MPICISHACSCTCLCSQSILMKCSDQRRLTRASNPDSALNYIKGTYVPMHFLLVACFCSCAPARMPEQILLQRQRVTCGAHRCAVASALSTISSHTHQKLRRPQVPQILGEYHAEGRFQGMGAAPAGDTCTLNASQLRWASKVGSGLPSCSCGAWCWG